MAIIFTAHMETDWTGWTEWTGETDTDNHFDWSAGAALAGTAGGADGEIADTTVGYVYKTGLSSTTNKFRCRFYFDPNGTTFVATVTGLMSVRSAAANTIGAVSVFLSGGKMYIQATLILDTGSAVNVSSTEITDAPHCIELYWQRAATNLSADGRLDWWVDGVAQTSITDRDNYDYWGTLDAIRFGMGPYWNVPAGVSGHIYLDEFEANDDGGTIGAYVPVSTTTSTSTSTVTDWC